MALESAVSSIWDFPEKWKNSPVVGHGLWNSITLWVRPCIHLKECKHTDGYTSLNFHTLVKAGGQTGLFNSKGNSFLWEGAEKVVHSKKKANRSRDSNTKYTEKKKKRHLYTFFQKAKQLTVQNFLRSSLNLLCGTRVYAKDPVPNLDMVHKREDALKRILKITPNWG